MPIVEDGRELPVTHRYRHPAAYGLGQHHADGDLAVRSAIPGVELEDLMPEARISMADLDMPDGCGLSEVGTDGAGATIFAWVDRQGTQRRTALAPTVIAQFVRPV